METKGLEPSTPGMQSCGQSIASGPDRELTETSLSVCTRVCTSDPENVHEDAPVDADLQVIIERWPDLPDAVKAEMLAMVCAASTNE